jgi:malate dehydrogenase (oxaloacetate-decarboxylating)(NADP+)
MQTPTYGSRSARRRTHHPPRGATPTTDASGCLSAQGGPIFLTGTALLTNSLRNKGTAFTEKERDALGLRGLVPPRSSTIEEQVRRVLSNYARQPDALAKYIYLVTLQNRNETLFYRVLEENLEAMTPIIYTPTVGQACLEYGAIYRRPRGMFISLRERGRIAEILQHWPYSDARMIVVTDGERILGLGDLGALGMGIPVGKLSLYTACAGVHPYYTLPVTLDVGTDNAALRTDPLYIGLNQPRLRGPEYDAFIAEFVAAVRSTFPKALIQWEDFGNQNAFRILQTYRDKVCSFNDDIQGTAAVALAGILGSLRLSGGRLRDQRLLFLGAGEAGTGIADLYTTALRLEGDSESQARARSWFVDSQGLVVRSRLSDLAPHKRPYAHEHIFIESLAEAVRVIRPTILIGVSGTPRTFTPEILRNMAALNHRPVIFALSNPTSKSECTAEEAYRHTDGRAIFASGSPFEPVTLGGRTHVPGQGNNLYVFPGIGLGALVCEATQISDMMFLRAAQTLASIVTDKDLELGRVYPPFSNIRAVSAQIATAIAEEAYRTGLAGRARPADLGADLRSRMYVPVYRDYV